MQDNLPWAKPDGWLDTIAPTTTISLTPSSPNGANNWYVSQVIASISASDNTDGSGVKEIHYILDGSTGTTFTGTMTLHINAESYHTLEAWAIDNNGNIETPHATSSFKIDMTAPKITIGSPAEFAVYPANSGLSYQISSIDNLRL